MRTWALILAATMALFTSPASAQSDYPNRAITLVVPLPPGGTNDILARAVADKLSAGARPAGGGGEPAGRRQRHGREPRGRKGPADGYTLLLAYTTTVATAPEHAARTSATTRARILRRSD